MDILIFIQVKENKITHPSLEVSAKSSMAQMFVPRNRKCQSRLILMMIDNSLLEGSSTGK